MDAKVIYWTAALLNLGVIVALALRGVAQVRRGEVEAHRRSMLAAAALIVAFLVSYPLKLLFLGREDLAAWSALHVHNLHLHETCVALMLLAGAVALSRARAMRGTRQRTRDPASPPAPASTVRWHHRAGWTGVSAAVAGFLTACGILAGMVGRS